MDYEILDSRSALVVAILRWEPGQPPQINCDNPQVRAELLRLIGRDLLTVEDPDAFGDLVDEGAMCYLGQRSVTPTNPAYITVLTRQLPLLTHYEIRLPTQTLG